MGFKNNIYRTDIYDYVTDATPNSLTQASLREYLQEKGVFEALKFEQDRHREAIDKIISGDESTAHTRTAKDAGSRIHDHLSAIQYTKMLTRFGFVHFGSARPSPESPDYQNAYEISKQVAEKGDGLIVNINGGGPGIMEATSKGAVAGGAIANGLTIALPFEPDANDNLTREIVHNCFGTRLEDFCDRGNFSYADLGGIGTSLEILLLMQLRQVKHVPEDHIIAGNPAWKDTIDLLIEKMYTERKAEGRQTFISPEDRDIVSCYTDDPAVIVDEVEKAFSLWKKKIYNKFKKSAR